MRFPTIPALAILAVSAPVSFKVTYRHKVESSFDRSVHICVLEIEGNTGCKAGSKTTNSRLQFCEYS